MSFTRQSASLAWVLLRLALGWTFFWGFIDKVFGLGFATEAEAAWLNGGSPTFGFLNFGTKGPFAEVFQGMAGNVFVDWLFMLGLLGIGVALLAGVAVRAAAWAGVSMMVLMYIAGFIPPEHNPFVDEHLINAIVLFGLANSNAGATFGFQGWWRKTSVVKNLPFLG